MSLKGAPCRFRNSGQWNQFTLYIVEYYGHATATHGFLLSKGAFTTIDVPGAFSTGSLTPTFLSRPREELAI